MRSVNIAELKNRLSTYLTFAKAGEEIVIRDRNLPVAKLVPFAAEQGNDEELLLVAAGKMRLPQTSIKVNELSKIPTGRVARSHAIQALLDDRKDDDQEEQEQDDSRKGGRRHEVKETSLPKNRRS